MLFLERISRIRFLIRGGFSMGRVDGKGMFDGVWKTEISYLGMVMPMVMGNDDHFCVYL